jgi:DNA processing protein
MDVDARVEAWARLQLVPGLGTRAIVALLKALGDPVVVCSASREMLARWVPGEIAAAIRQGPDTAQLERTLAWLASPGHSLVAWDDADYPAALLSIADPPVVFYHVGRRDRLNAPAIAVVGSRNATAQGMRDAEAFAAALSAAGLTIVSGLDPGIDAAAHRGGLSGAGRSLAVLGGGLDRVDPPANRRLAERVAATGALISEFPLGVPALAVHLPQRNRCLSGLCRGVLVIEATARCASLSLARLAVEQGRDVFAIPGSIHSPFSKGAHRLIKEGAKLVETASDVLEELQLQAPA